MQASHLQFCLQLARGIAQQFGSNCEIILHDLTKDYNHTIVDIRNGHITDRNIGDCGSNLGLEVLRGTVQEGDRYNYVVYTRDGKILRSSTMFIKNDEGNVIGCLCINLDITETVRLEEFLKRYARFSEETRTCSEAIFENKIPAKKGKAIAFPFFVR